MAEAENPEDALPIKKTSNTVYIVAGVGAVLVLGLVFGMGGDDEKQKAKAESSTKAANAAEGMTKAELEERAAHIKKTQAALQAAAVEEDAEARQKQAADAQKNAQAQAAAAPPSSGTSSGPAPKPKPSGAAKKKQLNSLDGLGADIAGALK